MCAIKEDLADRWRNLSCRVRSEPLLIACGETARRFRDLADLPGRDLPRTPHPSRNQWGMALELYKTMECIRRVLQPPPPTGEE